MIEVLGLTRHYGGEAVVSDVSFHVPEGELLVLVGGSGSGKTTTLKMINRLVEPSAGRVLIGGEDASTLEPHALRRRIGYVFQGIGLFPHLTVAENVAVPLQLARWERDRITARVTEVLTLVDLDPSLGTRFPSELSGGQQQRVGVARALSASPRLMLLDEPFGALDPMTRDRLQQSFGELRRRLSLTGVFVTHDMTEALLLADRIGVMRAGRLVQTGTPREVLGSPADPHVKELLDAPRRYATLVQSLLEGPR